VRSALPALLCLGLAAIALGCGRKKPPARPEPTPAPKASAVAWLDDYEEGLRQAKEGGKPLMVDVFAPWCEPCKELDRSVFSRSDVGELSKQFVAVKVDGDQRRDLVAALRVSGYPTTVFLSAEEKELGRARGAVNYQEMLETMRDALGRSKQGK